MQPLSTAPNASALLPAPTALLAGTPLPAAAAAGCAGAARLACSCWRCWAAGMPSISIASPGAAAAAGALLSAGATALAARWRKSCITAALSLPPLPGTSRAALQSIEQMERLPQLVDSKAVAGSWRLPYPRFMQADTRDQVALEPWHDVAGWKVLFDRADQVFTHCDSNRQGSSKSRNAWPRLPHSRHLLLQPSTGVALEALRGRQLAHRHSSSSTGRSGAALPAGTTDLRSALQLVERPTHSTQQQHNMYVHTCGANGRHTPQPRPGTGANKHARAHNRPGTVSTLCCPSSCQPLTSAAAPVRAGPQRQARPLQQPP